MRTRLAGLHFAPVDVDDSGRQGLVELSHCRCDLSLRLLAWRLLRDGELRFQATVAGAGADTTAPLVASYNPRAGGTLA